MIIETYTEEQTKSIGRFIGQHLQGGDILCLEGELGVGKTVFSKGVAEGLNIFGPITSPTFTIVNEYDEGRIPFYHFDTYRIEEVEEMDEIGYEEYFFGQGVSLIEWPSKIREIMPGSAIWFTMEKELDKGTEYRRITIEGTGQRFETLRDLLRSFVKGVGA